MNTFFNRWYFLFSFWFVWFETNLTWGIYIEWIFYIHFRNLETLNVLFVCMCGYVWLIRLIPLLLKNFYKSWSRKNYQNLYFVRPPASMLCHWSGIISWNRARSLSDLVPNHRNKRNTKTVFEWLTADIRKCQVSVTC